MERRRKVWQHDVMNLSVDQLRELVHALGWEVDHISDYGEDLFVRIFHKGNPTGHDFYIQLKGTRNIKQYALKSGVFSYPVKVICLQQWRRFPLPVVFVLWDIKQRAGYWLHLQPFIEETLKQKPQWLSNPDSKRCIHIPFAQALRDGEAHSLRETIDAEYEKIKLAKQHLERSQKEGLDNLRRTLETRQEASIILQPPAPLPPKVQQQLLIAQYQAAIAANPSDIKAWLGQAEVYYELNEMDKALMAINKAWELNCQDPQVVDVRACVLAEYAIAKKGEPKSMLHEAIDLFESLRDKTSDPASVDYNIGNCLAGLGDHRKAIEHFDRALAASPSPELPAQIWKNRGTSYFHLGNHVEEIDSYKKALELNPNLWEAYSSWAATELHHGHFEHARDLFMKAFQANPELEVSGYPQLYSLAYTLWRLGDSVEAYRRVNQALALKPDHQDGLLLKTHLLSQLWREDPLYSSAALAFFKSRVLDNPEDMFARGELYLIYNSEGHKEDARSILEETVSSRDALPQSLYHYSMVLEDEGKVHEAIHYLEIALEKTQEHHIVHALGRLKKKAGDYRSAIEFYELALRDVTDPLSILHSIADCYHFLDEQKECVRVLARAILVDPRNEISWTNLQYALAQLGEEGLFSVFTYFLYELRIGKDVADEEVEAAVDELLSRLRVQFGEEFVLSITSAELN